MEVLLSIIESPVFKRFVVPPLAVIGFYQIFRGVTTIIQKDLTSHEWPAVWVIIAYVVLTVLGCIALVAVL